MSFNKYIDLALNGEYDSANTVFHDLIVQKSKSIYESIIALKKSISVGTNNTDDNESDNDSDDNGELVLDIDEQYKNIHEEFNRLMKKH